MKYNPSSIPPLEIMRMRVGITDPNDHSQDDLLSLYIDDAREFILAFTHRDSIPSQLNHVLVRVAIVLYNRRGMEGSGKYSVGDNSFLTDSIPPDIIRQLNSYRAARVITIYPDSINDPPGSSDV